MGILNGTKYLVLGFASKRSIAYGIANSISEQGGEVILCTQNEKLAEKARLATKDLNVIDVIHADLSIQEDIDKLSHHILENHGHINGIVHSIAFAPKDELQGYLTDHITQKGFLDAQHISVFSFIALAKYAAQLMPNGGSMLCLSYIGANLAFPGYNTMGIAKASLESSVKYLALDLGRHQIRVNAISAGSIRTISASAIAGFRELHEQNQKNTPLAKETTINEVGDASAFLLSNLSRGITGETLYVDNGFHSVGMNNPQE